MYSVIFKLLSLKCDFYCRILHFCSEFALIRTGNTTKTRQNNATLASRLTRTQSSIKIYIDQWTEVCVA
jgi:hypothetical protein